MGTGVMWVAVALILSMPDVTARRLFLHTSDKPPRPDDEQSANARPLTSNLAGTWKSAPDELKLTSDFDKSVWGPNATSVRTVELTIRSSGEGTLKVTRKVVDGRGRTVAASTSIEEARLQIGAPQKTIATRLEHAVKVVSAERRYSDDATYRSPIEGLGVKVVTFEDGDGNTLEVRFDTPEGRGSFWETLRREGRGRTSRSVPTTSSP